jgi:hypothetical protein
VVVVVVVVVIVIVIAAMVTIVVIAVLMVVVVMTVVVTVITMLVISLVHAIVLARPLELTGPRKLLFTAALILRPTDVFRRVLPGADEVNGSIAGVVLVTVSAPIVRMFGWNMQVQRFDGDCLRGRLNDHRLRI